MCQLRSPLTINDTVTKQDYRQTKDKNRGSTAIASAHLRSPTPVITRTEVVLTLSFIRFSLAINDFHYTARLWADKRLKTEALRQSSQWYQISSPVFSNTYSNQDSDSLDIVVHPLPLGNPRFRYTTRLQADKR